MTMSKRSTTTVGVFPNRQEAERAVADLKQAGFREDQIGMVSPDKKTRGKRKAEKGSMVEEGAVAGLAGGAGVGALWALGIAAGLLPGIGPIVAGGLLGSLLASAAAGAAAAGLAGALIGLGIPEEEAEYYEEELKAGRTIVTVKAGRRHAEAATILTRHGGYDMHTREEQTATQGATRAEGEQKLEVTEEELHPRKQTVKTGEVRVRKEVKTEQRTINVPVTREEVVIERRPASGRRAGRADFKAEEVRIPVKEEQVRVEKQPVVKEEVRVGKRKVQGTEQVSGTVRKEKVRVEHEGDARVRSETGKPRRTC
jgi:uncharacterized protein (TIGR02271 family)